MQGKDTTKSTFFQLFEPIFQGGVFKWLNEQLNVDRYIKKFTTAKFFMLIVLAQLEQHRGLRDISSSLNDSSLSHSLGLNSISHSQISRKLCNLPTQAVQVLFQHIIRKAGIQMGFENVRQILGQIYLIDSSTISLSLTRYRWAEFRKTKSGIKLHLRLSFFGQGFLPDEAIVTSAKPADKTQMDNLVVEEKGALNVFDRAYVDYVKFDLYCEKDIRFVTRLKSNAVLESVNELSVMPGSNIKRDRIVILGKGQKKMEHPLRLIETEDTEGKPVAILTNDFVMTAEEIGDIYRCRWQIELFFKWLKQHMHVKHFYGLSEQAVENQLLIALITYCLLILLKLGTGHKGPLLEIKRLLHTCLYLSYQSFVKKLKRQPTRSSLGRRSTDYEAIFQETYRQVIAGEADHLDDLIYDPVIL